jgi:hypothetical protein
MTALRCTFNIRYTPPGGSEQTLTEQINATYTASDVGSLDVPAATADATEFEVPLGSVDGVKAIGIKNNVESEVCVRWQGANADEFSIAPGAMLLLAMPISAPDTPITGLSITTTALIVADGTVDYWVFGD